LAPLLKAPTTFGLEAPKLKAEALNASVNSSFCFVPEFVFSVPHKTLQGDVRVSRNQGWQWIAVVACRSA